VNTSTEPEFTFVIATRDRENELAAVVERLLQTTDCPIIVVDNHSRDGSVARMRQIEQTTDRLRLLPLGSNLGAVARNIGVAACRTPYVAFCDDDSWWAADAVPRATEIFDAHPDIGLIAARTLVWPGDREDPVSSMLAASPLPRRPGLPGPAVLGFLSCSAMVRRCAFEAAGGFSPILHFRGEEQLLAMDLAALGWELCYCAELTAIHRPSTVRPPTPAQDARALRNATLTTWLRRPAPQCVQAAVALLRAAMADRAHARAAMEAVLRVPAVLSQRRLLPAEVEAAVRLLEDPHPDNARGRGGRESNQKPDAANRS
jgi:GT2 family glycosyltransferase